ncbi:MAG: hypothetical protein A2014_09270 [Spirochaetes bacterium GWF1_49_6]|nr:MAG: hypothetical protein A2014_09270 [Spirochaetes bacterium GWF1_49_6]
MGRNDGVLDMPDSGDINEYNKLVSKALQARRKIETGFIELAESIYDIHKKKLYRIKYSTFREFCEEELGFSGQTIYVYISILKLITSYPDYFPKERAIEFGHKKMRFITEGVNTIDNKNLDKEGKEKKKIEILETVSPEMASTEIESYIEDIISDLP